MKKSKKLLTLLLATMLVLALMIGVVACNPPEDPSTDDDTTTEETTTTETLLVNNGKFATTTGATYVKSASNWTLTAGAWAKSSTGLTTGVIDLSSEAFANNKGAIDADIGTPGIAPSTPKTDGKYDDTNALIINMKGEESNGSIFYASSTASVKKGTYYKLTFDVWTDLIFDENVDNSKRGAAIVVSQGTSASSVVVAQFLSINTNEEWQTYSVYIEGSNFEDRSFNVQLWLGYGPAQMKDLVNKGNTSYNSTYTAKGAAMFDNVIMDTIEKSEYDSALVNQYNALASASETERTQEMQKAYGVVSGKNVVISYEYLNNNFTGATGYSTSSSQSSYFTSAKVGSTANYTVITGEDGISQDEKNKFPAYGGTNDPTGVFDMSKLYYNYVDSQDATKNDNYANAYGKVASSFIPPVASDLGVTYSQENGYQFTSPANALESQALLIYHQKNAISGAGFKSSFNILIENNKYYAISVWVYIWVPEVSEEAYCGTKPVAPEEGVENYESKLAEYNKKKAEYDVLYNEWQKYDAFAKNANGTDPEHRAYATLRLQGSSTNAKPEVQSDGTWGSWQQLTLKVKGNELADRKVGLELWYGEGKWGESTLYPGGCFFDNITIMEYDNATDLNNAYNDGDIKEWDSINEADYAGFGINGATQDFVALGNEEVDGWYYNVVDTNTFVDMNSADSNLYAGILSGSAVKNGNDLSGVNALKGLTFEDKDVLELGATTFDFVVLNNAKYTASKLYYKPSDSDTVLKTAPNHFYRLSMWVNTQNLKNDSNFSISLYDAENDSLINSSATQASLAVSEWTEISFVLQASATESDEMYMVVEFGKGDIYTPASHTQGAVIMTAITWKEIEYSEYKAASGSYIKSFDLSGSTTTGSSITNSDFSAVDSSNYDLDEEDDKVFDDNGKIVGVASPKSWTIATEAYLISAPVLSASGSYIQWKETVKDATHYHIYNADKELVKVIPVATAVLNTDYTETTANEVTTRTYQFAPNSSKFYYVRALVLDTTEQKVLYASPLSNSKNVTSATGSVETTIENNVIEEVLDSVKGGIVNANDYLGTGLGADFYPAGDADTLGYTSTLSSNLLMLTSNYPTYFGYTNSSAANLTTESFYRLSVWVKTIGDTKASVTLKNSSNYLAVTHSDADAGEYVGYTGINTQDKWVRYDFYIATNLSSGNVTLELYLGNKYANNTTELANGTKVSSGASAGTVYFDDVMLVKLADENAYNKLVYGVDNLEEISEETIKEKLSAYGVDVNDTNVEFTTQALLNARKAYALNLLAEKSATDSFFNNSFKFELVNYTTDSFDNYDKKSDDPETTVAGLLGNESNSFTHYETDAVYNGSYAGETDVKDNDTPNHVYGVYNRTGDFDDLIAHMTNKEYLLADSTYALADRYTADQIREFLTTTYTDGKEVDNNNYLMMANITKPSAQHYKTNSLTMAANSYYKITFYAKYLSGNSDSTKMPEFRFVYDKSNDYWQTIQIKASNDMVEYTFLYANESTKSVSAILAYYLGSDDAQGDAEDVKNLMAGILMVDDLSIEKVTADEYATEKSALEGDTNKAGTFATYLTEAEEKEEEKPVEDEKEDEEEEDEGKQINPQVWLIISSVVIGLILVAVIVIMIYRKLKTKVVKKLRKTKVDSAMPADFEKKQAQEKVRKNADSRKKDIDTSDYND